MKLLIRMLFNDRINQYILAIVGILVTVGSINFAKDTTIRIILFLIAGICIIYLSLGIYILKKDKIDRDEKYKLKKRELDIAQSRDIKLFFPKGSPAYYNVLKAANLLNMTTTEEITFIRKDSYAQYYDFKKLVEDETHSVVCRILNKNEKAEKCFIQVGFVVMDKNDKTILIERIDHASRLAAENQFLQIKKECEKQKAPVPETAKPLKHSFLVSFSPIPDRYNENVKVAEIYHREVPISEYEPDFQEIGFGICDWSLNNNKPCYCFYVFSAKYPIVSFDDEKTISSIFKDKTTNKFFIKDHDPIREIITFKELSRRSTRPENAPAVLLDCTDCNIYLQRIDKRIADNFAKNITKK